VQWLRSVVEGYGELLEREDKESTNEESDDRNAHPVTWVQIEREAGPIANDILSVIERLESLGQASRKMLSKIEDVDLALPIIDSNLSNNERNCLDQLQHAMRSSEWYLWLDSSASSNNEIETGDVSAAVECSMDDYQAKTEDLRHLATIFKKLAELAKLQKGKPLWLETPKKVTESKCIEWLVEEVLNFNSSQNTTGKRFPLEHVVKIAQVIHDSLSSPKAPPVLDTAWGTLEFNRIKARMKRLGRSPRSSRLAITDDDSLRWIQDPVRQKIEAAKGVLHRAHRVRKETK
jgi:DnaJ-domain-containing protein 1